MGAVIRRVALSTTGQVVVALLAGILLGVVEPALATAFSDIFIKLIKMVIPPIAFLTIVIGIAEIRDLRRLGSVGGRALIYFEIVSTLARIVGLIVMNVIRPGDGFDRSAVGGQAVDVAKYASAPIGKYMSDFALGIVPDNAVAAFAKG